MLLKDTNRAAYEELVDLIQGVTLRPFTRDTVPSDEFKIIGKWKCKKCDRIWYTSIVERGDEKSDIGCLWCRFNSIQSDYILLETNASYHDKSVKNTWYCKKCKKIFYGTVDYNNKIPNHLCEYYGVFLLSRINPLASKDWNDTLCKSNEICISKVDYDFNFKCSTCGNDYKSNLHYQAIMGRENKTACPYCNNVFPMLENSVQGKYPELLDKWDYELNHNEPRNIHADSLMNYYFKCEICGTKYKSTIYNEVTNKNRCTACENGLTKNDVKKIYKHISRDYKKVDYISSSSKDAHYETCNSCGMKYRVRYSTMFKTTEWCPYCNQRKVIPGINSIDVLYPELMIEWDYISNYLINDPNKMVITSDKECFWICKECGYKYLMPLNMKIYNNYRNKKSCPQCKGIRQTRTYSI